MKIKKHVYYINDFKFLVWESNSYFFLDVNIKQQKFEPIYAIELYMFCSLCFILWILAKPTSWSFEEDESRREQEGGEIKKGKWALYTT